MRSVLSTRNTATTVRRRSFTLAHDAAVTASLSRLTLQGTTTVGPATYVAPADPAQAYQWVRYDSSTKLLYLRRVSDQKIECHYGLINGSGKSRTLTLVTIGAGHGENVDWVNQCDPASYNQFSNGLTTTPQCYPPVGAPSGSPVAGTSTLIRKFNFLGGGDPVNSANGVFTSVMAFGAAVAAGVAMLLG